MLKIILTTSLFIPTIFASELENKTLATWQDFAELTQAVNKISEEDLDELNSQELPASEIIEKTGHYIDLTIASNPKFRIKGSCKTLKTFLYVSIFLFIFYTPLTAICYPKANELCYDITCNQGEILQEQNISPQYQCLSFNPTKIRKADFSSNDNMTYFIIGHIATSAPIVFYLGGQCIRNIYRRIMYPKKTKNHIAAMKIQLKEIKEDLLEYSNSCPTLNKYFPWNKICPAAP